METYSKSVCELKHEFVKMYKGNSHTTEILPNMSDKVIQNKKSSTFPTT